MKHCQNDECPDLRRDGVRGEFYDTVVVCPACGAVLADGQAPAHIVESEWVERVCVASCFTPVEAQLTKAALEAAGIPAFVENEHLAGIQWLYSQAVGGVRVMIDPAFVDDARAVLTAPSPEREVVEGSRCPHCGDHSLPPPRLRLRTRALSLLLGLPFSLSTRRRRCSACGRTWRVSRTDAD